MGILYHYCSVEAFFSILSNKSIWLSNVNSMNDHQENKWLDQFILDELRNKMGAIGEASANLSWESYIKNKPNPFIFCLSSDPDVLSQWR
ncbi:hypothetical protein [Castellaniella ginsengisoli]|uniref:DUF2971 domain-containing protein n=1 Tax=Castellaniella ginsengisoli TaxID=546114 RepID=A0AB39D6Y3_9BURK